MEKTRLRWFGHVQRRLATVPLRKSLAMKVDGPVRGRSRPKRTWMEIVKIDMKYGLSEDLAWDRSEWRNRIHVADPNLVGTRLCCCC